MNQRVCLITPEFPPCYGGVGISVQRIGTLLAECGYEVHVVVMDLQEGEPLDLLTTEASVPLLLHRIRVRGAERESSLWLKRFFHLKELHETFQYSVFHCFYISSVGLISTLLAAEVGRPCIASVRGADLEEMVFNDHLFAKIMWTLQQATKLTFVSEGLMARALALDPNLKLKSSIIYNSIAPCFQHTASRRPLETDSSLVIGCHGRFRIKKGTDYLLRAFRDVCVNESVSLLLIGDFKESDRPHFQKLLHEIPSDRVLVTGFMSRNCALSRLNFVDIYVHPSIHDGCPNAILEAMMCAKPILATKVGALERILQDKTTGLLVRPRSVAELVDALLLLIHNPSLRTELGTNAQGRVLREFTPDSERKSWKDLYQTIA